MSAVEGSDQTSNSRAPPAADPPSRRASVDPRAAARSRQRRIVHFLQSLAKAVATICLLAVAALAVLVIWDDYVTAPWTRDGRIRVQVSSVAPQVSGQVTELHVADNQYVHKGDTLYVIDRFDYEAAYEQAKQQLAMKAADVEVKKLQAERRKHLSDLATTAEEQQQYVGYAVQAQAAFEAARSQVAQAEINLKRTRVSSPVNGFVTNLLMRVGDYAHAGTANISVIDADSYWIDGYFEETKLAHVCVGNPAEAQLLGYAQPVLGRVETVTRGISVSDATPSTQGLPNVDPVYTWVRLAQRVPVRIAITSVPPGVPLVSGLTATVTIHAAAERDDVSRRWDALKERIADIFHRPQPNPTCVPAITEGGGVISKLPELAPSPILNSAQIVPGVAPGLTKSPKENVARELP